MYENTEYMKCFFEVFEKMKRQGPGSKVSTIQAFRSLPEGSNIRTIMEIGCGKGLTSLVLAGECNAKIISVDNHKSFLDFLAKETEKQGLDTQIEVTCASMFELDFPDGSFDLLWAEGCAYIMGFKKALIEWKRLLRDNGFLFVSDAVLLTDRPSPECVEYWETEYPDITNPDSRIRQAESFGYEIIDSFILPCSDWADFYNNMQKQLDIAIEKHGMTSAFKDMEKEISIYKLYGNEYGYICLLLKKR
jgi:SAM-dependent methyltransferase